MSRKQWFGAGVIFLGLLPLIACGSQPQQGSPIGPSNSAPSGAAPLLASTSARTTIGDDPIFAEVTPTTTVIDAEITPTSLVAGTACPTLQFMVNTYSFKTDASTAYENGSCADIRAGTKLAFKGSRPSETSLVILVSRISFKNETTPTPTPKPTPTPIPTPKPTPTPTPVEGEGVVASLVSGTACPTLEFLIGSYTFKTDAATQYETGGCTDIKEGKRVGFRATKQDDASLLVSRIGIKNETTPTPAPKPTPTPTPTPTPKPVEGEGVVASLVSGTACPTLQFLIGSYTFKTDAATQYETGGCTDIKAGTKVSFRAIREGDGSVLVSRIGIKSETTPAPKPVEGEIVVTNLVTGTGCPTLRFMVNTYTINTDASTAYENGSCADVRAGTKLALRGTRPSEGDVEILASRISFKHELPPAPTPVDGEGAVVSLVNGTACPNLQFMIASYTIKTDGSTQYDGGSCTDIKAGMKVGIRAARQSDGSLLASRIAIKNDAPPPSPPVEGEGVIASLVSGTACPTLQFMIGSYTIRTDAATQHEGGSCTDIKAGTKVGVRGIVQGPGSVLSTRIRIQN